MRSGRSGGELPEGLLHRPGSDQSGALVRARDERIARAATCGRLERVAGARRQIISRREGSRLRDERGEIGVAQSKYRDWLRAQRGERGWNRVEFAKCLRREQSECDSVAVSGEVTSVRAA